MTGMPITAQRLELVHPAEGVGTLDFVVEPGASLVILGRNGAGKTTLLRTLAGLLPAKSGAVLLGETPIAARPARWRAQHMSMVASTPPRGSALTVRDTIALAFEVGGAAVEEDTVPALLASAGMKHWADLQLNDLSDGMAQRVMMVRAFCQADSLVLLDEPTAFLDVAGRKRAMEDMGKWCASGKSVVLSTHDIEAVEAAGWANRWMVLRPRESGGTVFMDGPFDADLARELLMQEEG